MNTGNPSPNPAGPAAARAAGFTFIEVICILLVVSFGLMGVVGLVSHGLIVAQRSQGTCTGMVTAMVVANDAQPYLAPGVQGSWSYAPYDFDDATSSIANVAEGFVNGYYVKRTETTGAADVIAIDPASHVQARSVCVAVDVFDTLGGALVCSYNTRYVRQRGTP